MASPQEALLSSARDHGPGPFAGSALEVLFVFLRLGLTCFGGPVAHLGYFRAEFVVRRGWLPEATYADLVALCQFLPGPASSQVAFALGLGRAGWRGALAAWVGFTLPSAVGLVLFAVAAPHISHPLEAGLIHGLKLVAVGVVAQAVVGMARVLCPDRTRAMVAIASAIVVLVAPIAIAQVAAILLGALFGFAFCRRVRGEAQFDLPALVTPQAALVAIAAFFLLLIALPGIGAVWPNHMLEFVGAFYRSGALVFGGGHVVLPLLHDAVVTPGWVSNDSFLAGYAVTQAVPGPLFSFAAYLGAVSLRFPNGTLGAALALFAIFLPGMLILIGVFPFWQKVQRLPVAQATVCGVNAAVVGILAAALYDPLWLSSVHAWSDFGVAITVFVLLTFWRVPPIAVVALGVVAGIALFQ